MTKKSSSKLIYLATGGTGGHVFPALALARDFKKLGLESRVIGGNLASNRLVKGYPVVSVMSGPLTGIGGLFRIGMGTLQSIGKLLRQRPDLVVGFGGYGSAPVMFAAQLLGIKTALFESNIKMGKASKLFEKRARLNAWTFPVPGKTHVISPLWNCAEESLSEARAKLGLDPAMFTLLVFGGSQGSDVINRAVVDAVAGQKLQVLHAAGNEDLANVLAAEYKRLGIQAIVKPFFHDIGLMWRAADLAICRAGGMTIAEHLAFGVPAIFIPLPHSADNHQFLNAVYLKSEVKGCEMIEERELSSAKILACFAPTSIAKWKQHLTLYSAQTRAKRLLEAILEIVK